MSAAREKGDADRARKLKEVLSGNQEPRSVETRSSLLEELDLQGRAVRDADRAFEKYRKELERDE